ncbi:MAG: SCO family protein [Solirubrobacterales bacterium]
MSTPAPNMDHQSSRRKLIATLAVVVPIAIGLVIVVLGHFLGHETEIAKPTESTEPVREAAPSAAEAGTPAPRVRLTEGGTGRSFDSASLGDEPFAVIFISTDCDTIGGLLKGAVEELGHNQIAGAILAISADPEVDKPKVVSAWLAENHLQDTPFHYLIGSEAELKGYWNAWGTSEGAAGCVGTVPAHLVDGSGENAGIVDIDPEGEPSILTDAMAGLSK